MQKLVQPSSSMVIRDLKDFAIINDELYYRGSGGVLTRALFAAKAKEKLQRLHNFRDGTMMLASTGLQRQGYYWQNMAKEAVELQFACLRCQEPLDTRESLFMQSARDWRQPYL